MGGRTFKRKSPVAITLFKEGDGFIFEGGPIIGRLKYITSQRNALQSNCSMTIVLFLSWCRCIRFDDKRIVSGAYDG